MKLFITFGSWGEIAPLLEIALQLKEKGESVSFATTDDWVGHVRAYGIDAISWPGNNHKDSIDGFIRSQVLNKLQSFYELIEDVEPSGIISSIYFMPAQAYAEKHDIPYVATTTSPYYLMENGPIEAFRESMDEYMALRRKLSLGAVRPFIIAGLYPWYLHEPVGVYPCGFPELRSLMPLSERVAEFIKEPYGVVTRGTLVGRGELSRMVNAVKAHGFKCLYLGPHECDADLSAFMDNHKEAVKGAKVAITHAGIGTTVDCMGIPMVVDPVAYDQFYNATRLVHLKCAVPSKDSYIKAIKEAMKPRSFLPNQFYLDEFLECYEHPTGNVLRHAANVGEYASLH